MEKYGVDQDKNLTKQAEEKGGSCPSCGSAVEDHGAVKKCPVDGTEPFEGVDDTPKK